MLGLFFWIQRHNQPCNQIDKNSCSHNKNQNHPQYANKYRINIEVDRNSSADASKYFIGARAIETLYLLFCHVFHPLVQPKISNKLFFFCSSAGCVSVFVFSEKSSLRSTGSGAYTGYSFCG